MTVAGSSGDGSEDAADLINSYLKDQSNSTSTTIMDGKVKVVKVGEGSEITAQEIDALQKGIADVVNSGADGAKIANQLSADSPLTVILNNDGLQFGALYSGGKPANIMTLDVSSSIRFVNKNGHYPSKNHYYVRSTLTRHFAHESAHTVLGITGENKAVQFADRVEAGIWGGGVSTVRGSYSNNKWY